MADIPDSWEKYGFPNPNLWAPYKPFVGLIKAHNERCRVGGAEYVIPDFFSKIILNENDRLRELPQAVRGRLGTLDQYILAQAPSFVNPAKIPTASSIGECFWTTDDLLLAGADGVEDDIICFADGYYFPSSFSFVPLWPVKWAIQRYKQINLLRYQWTHFLDQWPFVEYKDLNNTFNFKAPEP